MKTENENEKNPKKRIQNKELKRKGKNFVNVFDMNFISPHFQWLFYGGYVLVLLWSYECVYTFVEVLVAHKSLGF